jgi:transcriptional regulator GlxA family with amidase domain
MSAIAEPREKNEPIQVLIALHNGFDMMDFAGPLEVFHYAAHEPGNSATAAFKVRTCGEDKGVTPRQGATVKVDMDFEDAEAELEDIDILVIPGGSTEPILAANKEPQNLIKAWAALQQKDPSKERTLFSVCTGSLMLAQTGVLQGLAATTHPDHYTKLETLCQAAAARGSGIRTDVMEERYVVNNARFDLGDNWDDNPFILPVRPDGRRKSTARKGSDAWRLSRRRESLAKRAAMPLAGLRVITAGGITCGIDAALYLVAALVSIDAATEVARSMQFTWQKGVTVDAIDV